jgi:tetratricopeptide (TPR) repeat protein
MRVRDRSAVLLVILAIALFAINWPINDYISNSETWHSHKVKNQYEEFVSWRPPRDEGQTFFNSIFRGGGGTPAILAMFGGQRYMIANIMWNYSDILFHQSGDNKQKLYDMSKALEATVTLNPAFTEAWSVHGWHLAWNLNAETTNQILKEKFLKDGENVYIRSIAANPNKPRPYFDLAWLYLSRTFEYQKAMVYLEYMVKNFEPVKPGKKSVDWNPLEADRQWDPKVVGHRLAYVYKKQGIAERNWEYIQRSIDVYQRCLEVEPTDEAAQQNIDRLKENFRNEAWMDEEYQQEEKIRQNYGRPSLAKYVESLKPLVRDGKGDHDDHGDDTNRAPDHDDNDGHNH